MLHSARLNIASIIVVFRLEFTQEGVFLSHLRSLNVCLGVVSEEEVIVSGVCLNPLSELRVGYKSDITVGLVMTRFVSKEEFLEICVIFGRASSVENTKYHHFGVVLPQQRRSQRPSIHWTLGEHKRLPEFQQSLRFKGLSRSGCAV